MPTARRVFEPDGASVPVGERDGGLGRRHGSAPMRRRKPKWGRRTTRMESGDRRDLGPGVSLGSLHRNPERARLRSSFLGVSAFPGAHTSPRRTGPGLGVHAVLDARQTAAESPGLPVIWLMTDVSGLTAVSAWPGVRGHVSLVVVGEAEAAHFSRRRNRSEHALASAARYESSAISHAGRRSRNCTSPSASVVVILPAKCSCRAPSIVKVDKSMLRLSSNRMRSP